MKTPQELAALTYGARMHYVVSTLSAVFDQACIEEKITKDGGSFEVNGLTPNDWQDITQHLTNHHWNALLKYEPNSGKYSIKVTPSDLSGRL